VLKQLTTGSINCLRPKAGRKKAKLFYVQITNLFKDGKKASEAKSEAFATERLARLLTAIDRENRTFTFIGPLLSKPKQSIYYPITNFSSFEIYFHTKYTIK
jgi:hypothetical protein